MKRHGIGIIGCGGIARAKHIPNLLKEDRAQVVALFDFRREFMEALKNDFNLDCSLYDNIDDFLADSRIEIVHVCTPNSSHAELTIKALKAGKHVMCEKPMATSVEDAARMVETARETGKKLTICSNNRFKEEFWKMKQICSEGMLGDIYHIKADYLRRRGVPTWGNFLNKKIQRGGPVIDLGTHILDLSLWFADNYEPESVYACTYDMLGKNPTESNPYGLWKKEDFTVEDFGVGIIRMKNGASIVLEASWLLNIRKPNELKVSLFGTKAGADVDDGLHINGEILGQLYDTEILKRDTGAIGFFKAEEVYGPALEIHKWLDAIENDTEPVTRPVEMLTVMKIIDAFYESAEKGTVVRID